MWTHSLHPFILFFFVLFFSTKGTRHYLTVTSTLYPAAYLCILNIKKLRGSKAQSSTDKNESAFFFSMRTSEYRLKIPHLVWHYRPNTRRRKSRNWDCLDGESVAGDIHTSLVNLLRGKIREGGVCMCSNWTHVHILWVTQWVTIHQVHINTKAPSSNSKRIL